MTGGTQPTSHLVDLDALDRRASMLRRRRRVGPQGRWLSLRSEPAVANEVVMEAVIGAPLRCSRSGVSAPVLACPVLGPEPEGLMIGPTSVIIWIDPTGLDRVTVEPASPPGTDPEPDGWYRSPDPLVRRSLFALLEPWLDGGDRLDPSIVSGVSALIYGRSLRRRIADSLPGDMQLIDELADQRSGNSRGGTAR